MIHKWQKCINDSYLLNHVNNLKTMTQIYTQLRKIEDLMSNVQSTEGTFLEKSVLNKWYVPFHIY